MNDPVNGIDLLIVIGVISLLFIGYSYFEWQASDLRRRADRLVRRLQRDES